MWNVVQENSFRRNAVLTMAGLSLLVIAASNGQAAGRIELEVSIVRGNKELPKVLYIVPWKRMQSGNVQQKLLLHSLFDDAFQPIDPQGFQQHVEDYRYFSAAKEE